MKNDRVKWCFLWSFLLIIALTACSNHTKRITSSSTTKKETSVLTKKEKNILKNGYRIENYNFVMLEIQKKNQDVKVELLNQISEIEERFKIQKIILILGKKLTLLFTVKLMNLQMKNLFLVVF